MPQQKAFNSITKLLYLRQAIVQYSEHLFWISEGSEIFKF
jgi:hypothetical protein